MAPEQSRGRPVSPATDVYSAGVVLYEMVAGALPFVANSAVELAVCHLQDPPPPLPASVPEPLRQITARALAKDPARRYADGGEMADALIDASRRASERARERAGRSGGRAALRGPAPRRRAQREHRGDGGRARGRRGGDPGRAATAADGAGWTRGTGRRRCGTGRPLTAPAAATRPTTDGPRGGAGDPDGARRTPATLTARAADRRPRRARRTRRRAAPGLRRPATAGARGGRAGPTAPGRRRGCRRAPSTIHPRVAARSPRCSGRSRWSGRWSPARFCSARAARGRPSATSCRRSRCRT